MTHKLYRIRKKSSLVSKAQYLQSLTKWNNTGRFFTGPQLLEFLSKQYKNLSTDNSLPVDWEIVDYQLIETATTPVDKFIQLNSKTPWIKGL